MGKVIRFSEARDYLKNLKRLDFTRATILDTNILISSSYEVRESHEEVDEILELLMEEGFRLLATVNTRSEFLEFHRRLALTETLLDLVDDNSRIRVPSAARAQINVLKGTLKTSSKGDREKDFVFNDSHLKKIIKNFSAGSHSGFYGWLSICEFYFKGSLSRVDEALKNTGVEYVSQHLADQKNIFKDEITWNEAINICEKSGPSFSDSMILNAFQASKCPFIVSMDFDVGYAVLSDPKMKDAIMPDRIAKEFKNYHFGGESGVVQ